MGFSSVERGELPTRHRRHSEESATRNPSCPFGGSTDPRVEGCCVGDSPILTPRSNTHSSLILSCVPFFSSPRACIPCAKACAIPVRASVCTVHVPGLLIPSLHVFRHFHFPPPRFPQPIALKQNSFHRYSRFHSHGYYYGLYTFFKTGYSSRFGDGANVCRSRRKSCDGIQR
jgi:hypothetical protein